MLSLPPIALFGFGATGFIAAVGYAILVGDYAGVALLFSLSVAAVLAGLGLAGTGVRDPDPMLDPGPSSPIPGVSAPSYWPMVTALGLTVLAVGAATGPGLTVLGGIIAAVALGTWFAQSWAEHPSWTPEASRRVAERVVLPIGLPVGLLVLIGVLVISFSRVLLAVSKNASVLAALLAALAILGVCSLFATRARVSSGAIAGTAILAAVLTVAGGIGGAVAGEREFHHAGGEHESEGLHEEEGDHAEGEGKGTGPAGEATGEEAPEGEVGADSDNADDHGDSVEESTESSRDTEVEVAAKNLAFDTKTIELPANVETEIVFTNEEAIPHNVSIYDGSTALFTGDLQNAAGTKTYKVVPLDPGTYEFRCDVHPATMKGEVDVA